MPTKQMINAAVDLCRLLLCADLIARHSFIDPGHLLIYSLVTRLVSYQKGKRQRTSLLSVVASRSTGLTSKFA